MFRCLMQLAGLALAPFAALLASRVFGMLAAAYELVSRGEPNRALDAIPGGVRSRENPLVLLG